jgi:hypothetical protein
MRAASHSPDPAISASTPSIAGVAHVKIAWKTSSTTARKISGPHTRCSSTASSLSLRKDGPGAAYDARSPIARIRFRRCVNESSTGSWIRCGAFRTNGCAPFPDRFACASRNSRTASTPTPARASVRTTVTPSSCASTSSRMLPPRVSSSSAMFSTSSVGRSRDSTGSTIMSCVSSRVASTIRISASGARRPSIRPSSASRVTRSSSVRAEKPFTPGRSSTSTATPPGRRARPRCFSTVTPG